MSTFLTGNDLNTQLQNLFENATEQLILISPYIKLHPRYAAALKAKKNNAALKIILVFGDNEDSLTGSMQQQDFDFFKDFANIEIRYQQHLQANYYANERASILTSISLNNFSQGNNIETGVVTNKKQIVASNTGNANLDNDAAGYFEKIISQAELLFLKQPTFENTTNAYIESIIETDSFAEFFGNNSISLKKENTTSAPAATHLVTQLGERVKELNCLYRLSALFNDAHKSMEDILQESVGIIPTSYQYPAIACARIVLNDEVFTSVGFKETKWMQVTDIMNRNTVAGQIQVFYKEQMKEEHEGPFLKEERFLLNSIAGILGSYAERKAAEKAIKEQLEVFLAILENANDSIWLLSPEQRVLQFNKTAKERLWANSGKEVYTGASFQDFLLPGSEDSFMSMFNAAIAGKYSEQEICLWNIEGEKFWIRAKMYPIYGVQQKLVGIALLTENISERKNAEENIKQSEANYRQLFDGSPAPMWVIDETELTIKQVNQACIKTYGYSKEELLGMKISDISHDEPGDTSKENMGDMFFAGSQRHEKKSGELIDVIASSIPVRLNGEKGILMIAIDVTEKNLYEHKLTKASIKVQEEERYEIGGELHDNVCQILAASLMFLGLLKQSVPRQSIEMFEQVHQYIMLATDEIRNLSHRLAPAFFDEETLEEALVGLLKTFNTENKYAIELNVDKKINQQLFNRDMQLNLYRILQEQLRNIVKHARATDIKIEIATKGKMLQMRIADNGIGFDPHTNKGGIGLANMNRRARLFSGSFKINSGVGKGCEVLVDIPL